MNPRFYPMLRAAALAGLLILPAADTQASESKANAPCLWSNVGEELTRLAASPVQGSWLGYGAAALFGAGLTVALENDTPGYRWVQEHRSEVLDKTMPVATLLGDGLFQLGASAALYQFGSARDQEIAAMAVEGQINVAVVSVLLKAVFTASRPDVSRSEQAREWFTLRLGNTSFPSGHGMTVFCAAAILGRSYGLEWLAYPLAAVTAYSRIYNQRHFPADVVAGAGLGLLIGHTVVNLHTAPGRSDPSVHFTLQPTDGGSLGVVTWHYQ